MPWLTIGNTFISIVNLILVSYNDLGYLQEDTDNIYTAEVFVGILFSIEFIYNLYMEPGKIV